MMRQRPHPPRRSLASRGTDWAELLQAAAADGVANDNENDDDDIEFQVHKLI